MPTTPTSSCKAPRSMRSYMDEFRDKLVSTFIEVAHNMWVEHYRHLTHLDEPNWKEEIEDILKDAVTDALAEPERQQEAYRGY
jgi:hypothetical protein